MTIELFDKNTVDSHAGDEPYNQFYQLMLSSMSDFSVYFDDFHKVIFRLNKKRNLLKGIITRCNVLLTCAILPGELPERLHVE